MQAARAAQFHKTVTYEEDLSHNLHKLDSQIRVMIVGLDHNAHGELCSKAI